VGNLRLISERRLEAAGVEPEIRGMDKFLMAHDFWREFVDTPTLAARCGLH
jgi:hypothetical protein